MKLVRITAVVALALLKVEDADVHAYAGESEYAFCKAGSSGVVMNGIWELCEMREWLPF